MMMISVSPGGAIWVSVTETAPEVEEALWGGSRVES